MSKFLGFFAPLGIGSGKGRQDGDFVDKLNHSYTTLILVIFAVVVSTKQYVGDPIQCWVPAQFTSGYQDYTNKICWVSNTYYKPFTEKIPDPEESRIRIGYYQWVPIILLFQTFMFFFPCLIWRMWANKSGLNVHQVLEAAKALHDGENREKTMRYVVKNMDRYFGTMREKKRTVWNNCKKVMNQSCLVFCGRKYGNYLTILYIMSKCLSFINVVGQLFMLNQFLGSNYHLYGVDVIHGFLDDAEEWSGSERFPRVTLCDFKVRQLGNIHRHTVQCVLPINLFNEKIFIFIWFWFVLVAIATGMNLIVWISRALFRNDMIRYVKHHLKSMDKVRDNDDKKNVFRYVNKYLRPDGVFIFRLISINCNDLTAAEIASEMWEYFKNNPPAWDRTRREMEDV